MSKRNPRNEQPTSEPTNFAPIAAEPEPTPASEPTPEVAAEPTPEQVLADLPADPPPTPAAESPLDELKRLQARMAELESAAKNERETRLTALRAEEADFAKQHEAALAVARTVGEKLLAIRAQIGGLSGVASANGASRNRAVFDRDANGRDKRLPPDGSIISYKVPGTEQAFTATLHSPTRIECLGMIHTSLSAAARACYKVAKGKDTQVDGFLAFGLKDAA